MGFSNAAIAVSHFTRNVDSLFFYLDWMAEDTRPNFGTDIGSALLTANEIIGRDTQPGNKVVLVISDGEDEGDVLDSAVAELRNKGASIYSIGIGGSRPIEVPVPADDGIGDAGWALKVRSTRTRSGPWRRCRGRALLPIADRPRAARRHARPLRRGSAVSSAGSTQTGLS